MFLTSEFGQDFSPMLSQNLEQQQEDFSNNTAVTQQQQQNFFSSSANMLGNNKDSGMYLFNNNIQNNQENHHDDLQPKNEDIFSVFYSNDCEENNFQQATSQRPEDYLQNEISTDNQSPDQYQFASSYQPQIKQELKSSIILQEGLNHNNQQQESINNNQWGSQQNQQKLGYSNNSINFLKQEDNGKLSNYNLSQNLSYPEIVEPQKRSQELYLQQNSLFSTLQQQQQTSSTSSQQQQSKTVFENKDFLDQLNFLKQYQIQKQQQLEMEQQKARMALENQCSPIQFQLFKLPPIQPPSASTISNKLEVKKEDSNCQDQSGDISSETTYKMNSNSQQQPSSVTKKVKKVKLNYKNQLASSETKNVPATIGNVLLNKLKEKLPHNKQVQETPKVKNIQDLKKLFTISQEVQMMSLKFLQSGPMAAYVANSTRIKQKRLIIKYLDVIIEGCVDPENFGCFKKYDN